MNDRSVMRSVLVWAVPLAVVVVALGYETDWGKGIAYDQPLPRVTAPAPVPVSLLPEYAINGGIDARRETVERTLFNPTRRAAPAATQTASSTTALQHGQYTLTGTTVTGNVATAFLREVKGGKSHTVRQGQALNGVTVAEVKPDYVKLSQGNDVEELRLKIASGPKTTVQPAPVAPAHTAQPAVPPQAAQAAVPGVAAPPATPANSVAELLARRRQAAREAAAAGSGSGNGVPAVSGATAPPAALPQPSAAVQKAAGGNADWARVYQGMGQVRH